MRKNNLAKLILTIGLPLMLGCSPRKYNSNELPLLIKSKEHEMTVQGYQSIARIIGDTDSDSDEELVILGMGKLDGDYIYEKMCVVDKDQNGRYTTNENYNKYKITK